MYKLTFCTSDSSALICDDHADLDILDTFLETDDLEETDEVGACLICEESVFLHHYGTELHRDTGVRTSPDL